MTDGGLLAMAANGILGGIWKVTCMVDAVTGSTSGHLVVSCSASARLKKGRRISALVRRLRCLYILNEHRLWKV